LIILMIRTYCISNWIWFLILVPGPRQTTEIKVTFTPRVLPTPARETKDSMERKKSVVWVSFWGMITSLRFRWIYQVHATSKEARRTRVRCRSKRGRKEWYVSLRDRWRSRKQNHFF
jgi:hypothetical protein